LLITCVIFSRFTSIIGNKKYKQEAESPPTTSRKLRSELCSSSSELRSLSSQLGSSSLSTFPSSVGLFPKECQICRKFQVKYNGKKVEPSTIATYDAERNIKNAARQRDGQLYLDIKDVDLISKEFKYHRHCYRNYIRVNENKNDQKNLVYEKGDFEAVISFVNIEIIENARVVSMTHLHSLYKLGVGDSRYTNKLKERLKNEYGDRITFCPRSGRAESEIIIGTCNIDNLINVTDEITLKNAALIIANDMKDKFSNGYNVKWPPSSNELSKEEFRPPKSINTFLTAIFDSYNNTKCLTNIQRKMISSIASDMVFGASSGKFIQLKHFLLSVGLHDLTGSRKVIDIVHGLGHCLSYNTTMEIKTGVAEQVLEQVCSSGILPLQPSSTQNVVPTFFWVDNFDIKIDRVLGGGSVNNTHLMAFQEITSESIRVKHTITVKRKKSRNIFYEDLNTQTLHIDREIEPPFVNSNNEFDYCSKEFDLVYFLWTFIRNVCSFNQTLPSFKGFILQVRNAMFDALPVKTAEIFLPPITAKVTDFTTIQKYLAYLKNLADSVNMPYVNVTLDVGAAINAFKTVWNHPITYANVVIHLGGFHFIKENFQVSSLIVTTIKNDKQNIK